MSAADMFWAAPPVSRTMTAAAVLLSVPMHMQLYHGFWVLWITDYVFTLRSIPQLWRLLTPFLITGGKLGMIMDPYFLFTYGKSLETEAGRFSEPGSFLVYLIFVAAIIIPTCGVYLGGLFFLPALTAAIAYTFAQENPNRQMNFFIVSFSARWLPIAMLAMTFIMASPYDALLQSTGILAAHGYDFVTRIWPEHGGGQRWLKTPQVVKGWFPSTPGGGQERFGGTAFAARPAGSRGQAGGATSSGNAFGNMGPGRRLGGD